MKANAFDRLNILAEAQNLLNKKNFTKEDRSKFESLLQMADRLAPVTSRDLQRAMLPRHNDPHSIAFRSYLASGYNGLDTEQRAMLLGKEEFRDITGGGGPTVSYSGAGAFVPTGFYDQVISMMKAVDRLFDNSVVTVIETETGGPIPVPNFDDTTQEATIISDTDPSPEKDPAALGALPFPTAETWRSGIIRASRELQHDGGVSLDDQLANAFAMRFARGIGKANVATLIAAATVGVGGSSGTATIGDDNASSPNPATQVGYLDLLNLIGSVDPAYVCSPRSGWLMKFSSLLYLLTLKDKAGRPIMPVEHNEAGDFLLFERPVYLCPSMDSIATGKKPIAFGALDRFIVRRVKSARVQRYDERYAESYQVAWQAYMRQNAGLQVTKISESPLTYSNSPIKYLQNA